MSKRIPNVSTVYITAQRLRVLEVLLLAKQPLHVRDIAKLADVVRETAYMNVRRLADWGWVQPSYVPGAYGRGHLLYYAITPMGRQAIDTILDAKEA